MAALVDTFLVGLALLASLVYALMALGPKSWRRRVRGALGFKSSNAKSAASCGGCEGCGGDSADSADSAAPNASTVIKIPVGKIGRR